MLSLSKNLILEKGIKSPIYPSKCGGGFITKFDRPVNKDVLEIAGKEEWNSEQVLDEVIKHGDTLKYARITFIGFSFAALALVVIVIRQGS